jgi:hypothetical protein
VNKSVGGPHAVPANMLPNGLPIAGTDDSGWSEVVKNASKRK